MKEFSTCVTIFIFPLRLYLLLFEKQPNQMKEDRGTEISVEVLVAHHEVVMVVIVTHTDVKVVMVDPTIKEELETTSNQNSEVEWVELDVVGRQVVDLVLHHHKVVAL